jgi:hypothetical protein
MNAAYPCPLHTNGSDTIPIRLDKRREPKDLPFLPNRIGLTIDLTLGLDAKGHLSL